jgi:hypothetical protein
MTVSRGAKMSEQKFNFDELVLLRLKSDSGNGKWGVIRYSYEEDGYIFTFGNVHYSRVMFEFLPYKGNEHLLGTTDDPEPKWEPKEGEVVRVRDREDDGWIYRRFKGMVYSGQYECYYDGSGVVTNLWKYCEPLTDEEKGNV